MKRKILSILIIFAMLFPFGIVANSVKATDAVNEVTVQEEGQYTNLSSAIEALKDKDGIIRLEKDITEKEDTDNEIKFSTGNITLDLNGHTITDDNNHKNDLIVVEKDAKLNIVNNVETEGKITVKDASAAAICNKGEVTISGNVTISYAGSDDAYYMVENFGDMTIEEGVTISSTKHKSSLIVNGISAHTHKGEAPDEEFGGANLIINGGTFKGGKYVIKNDQKGVLTINDGTFVNNLKTDGETSKNTSSGTGKNYAAILNSNKATITGGKFDVQDNSTKTSSVDIIQRAGEDGKGNDYTEGYEGPRLTIDGGVFESGKNILYDAAIDNKSNELQEGVTNVTDINAGTFNREIEKYLDEEAVEVYISSPKKWYVGEEVISEAVKTAATGAEIEVKQGSIDLENVPNGVTVKNSGEGNVSIAGTKVEKGTPVDSTTANMDAMDKKIKDLEEKLDAATKEAENSKTENENLSKDVEKGEAENKALSDQLKDVQAKLDAANKDVANGKTNNQELEKQLKEVQEELNKIKYKPATVKGLKASSQTTSSIKLSWTKVSNVTGYKVYSYNYDKKKWEYVGKQKSGTTYTVKKLKAGTVYKFRVRAYKTVDGEQIFGEYATSVKTTTKTKAPKISSVTSKSKKATVKWGKVSGASGYEVYMATSKSGKYTKIKTAGKSTKSYTKSSLKKGKTYYFKVRTYKTVDGKKIYSSYSSVKSIKVK